MGIVRRNAAAECAEWLNRRGVFCDSAIQRIQRPLSLAVLRGALGLLGIAAGAGAQSNCPDDTDTPAILTTYVGVAFRSLKSEPGRPLPEPCLLVAVAFKAPDFRDSTI